MRSWAICFMLLPNSDVGIVDAGAGLVLSRVGGAEHLDGFKGFVAGGVEDAVAALAVHGLEGVGGGGGSGAACTDGEVVDVGKCDGGNLAGEGARNLRAESQGAKGGVFLAMAEVFSLQGAVRASRLQYS